MKSEFLAGFVKFATEAGHSDEEVAGLWKAAMQHPQGREIFESFPMSVSPLDVNTLTVLTQVKQAMSNKVEVAKLKEVIKDICE